MKFGFRKFSLNKSIKARTTGRMTRILKKAVNPFYGKKGVGFIKNPKRAINNFLYKRTTIGVSDIARAASKKTSTKHSKKSQNVELNIHVQDAEYQQANTANPGCGSLAFTALMVIFAISSLMNIPKYLAAFDWFGVIFSLVILSVCLFSAYCVFDNARAKSVEDDSSLKLSEQQEKDCRQLNDDN